jgi:predicted RNase H-like nuclease (RuvC/YqgF family)
MKTEKLFQAVIEPCQAQEATKCRDYKRQNDQIFEVMRLQDVRIKRQAAHIEKLEKENRELKEKNDSLARRFVAYWKQYDNSLGLQEMRNEHDDAGP